MPNSSTVSASDIDFNILFETGAPSLVGGQWFTIRLMPDLVTGELFNVGVAFIDNSGNLHHRFIPNARPFQCLFGNKGLDNFNFLLNTVKKRFHQNDTTTIISPHVSFTTSAYASGDSIPEIIDTLFDTMINLRCVDEDLTELKDKSSLGTEKLRQTIFGQLKKDMPQVYERIYRDSPVYISEASGSNGLYLDLPIWNSNGNLHNAAPVCFGTIVSAAYKTKEHRGYHIEHGCLNVRNACEILGKKNKGGIFIFRPPVNNQFNEALNAQIDNEIDNAIYGLNKFKRNGYDLNIVVTGDKADIYKAAAEMS